MSVTEFVTPVRVVEGKLKIRDMGHFEAGLKALRNGEYLCRITKPRATRSNELNALYWAGFVAPMAGHTGYTPEEMHAYFKRSFLPKRHVLIQNKDGVVMDEADLDSLTTTDLTNDEFKAYLKEIENLALDLGVRVGSSREE